MKERLLSRRATLSSLSVYLLQDKARQSMGVDVGMVKGMSVVAVALQMDRALS